MFVEDIKNIKSEKKDLRDFGLTVGTVLGILGGLFFWKEKNFYQYFIIISAVLIVLGLALPSILKPLQKAWMTIAVVIGFGMTRVILTILFYIILTPTGLLARSLGNDFLDRKINKNADSYWIPKKSVKTDKSSYEKQF